MSNRKADAARLSNPEQIRSPESLTADAPASRLSFDELYAAHADRILNLLFRYTNSEEASRDLLQDVFLKVYQSLDSFRNGAEPGTWIHRIAVNHAINYLKREKRTLWFNVLDEKVGTLLQRDRIELRDWHAGDSPRPDHAAERAQEAELIEQAVQGLPLKYRIPYLLYRDGTMGPAEIAKTLGLSTSAVDSRIHRAKNMLLDALKKLLGDSG